MKTTRAFRTLDCAQKVRVHYYLSHELKRDFLALFPEAEVKLNEFSRTVEGARDHFSILVEGHFHVSGSLEGDSLIATFGRIGGEPPEAEIAAFEELLRTAGFGECVHHH